MKRMILMVVVIFQGIIFSATGWFSDYVLISKNGGESQYYWIGSDPSYGTQLDGYSFGIVSQLKITGADMKYWSNTQDRTGGSFFWRIGTTGDGNEVIWTHSSLGGNDYQGLWTGEIDILSGLDPNTEYVLHIWAKSWGSVDGDSYLSNGGNNYVATFTTDGSVPVELSIFSIKFNDDLINLSWQTATEINNYGFEIERSAVSDQMSEWTKIGFVKGNGNSNSTKNYSFTDNAVSKSGKYAYRLKQVDNDGSFTYSQIVETDVTVNLSYSLGQNYPNPFNPTTKISYSIPETGLVTLKVYNIVGEHVAELVNKTQEAGKYEIEFNGSSLSNGVYFYELKANGFTSVKKLMLLK